MNKWILGFVVFASSLVWAGNIADDLSDISLEKLMDIQVTGTSKYAQKASEAPADVTVINAEEIHAYGWRTLADLLNSVRGFNVSSDLMYSYAGVRGFSPPGDYNDRLLLLVNGHRINDNIYDQAYIGTEFPVDLSLVSSVEISRGPSSTLYGGNALFGIVNVVTKKGESINGNEVALTGGTGGYEGVSVTKGAKTDNGADMVLSASWTGAKGKSYEFPEFIPTNGTGLSEGADYLRNARFFASYANQGFSLMAFAAERTKGNPGALWSGVLGDPNNQIRDQQAHLEGSYSWQMTPEAAASARLFMGYYGYRATYALDGPPLYLSYDEGLGTWWGSEFKVDWKPNIDHRVIVGTEFQRDTKQHQTNYDVVTNLDDTRSGQRAGLYWQDDWHTHERFNVIYGLRLDRAEDASNHISPRLAGIWKPDAATTGKLMYGTAFRTANMFELHYAFPNQYVPPSSLNPETIRTYEVELERVTSDGAKLTGAIFSYSMDQQIVLQSNPALGGLLQYTNTPGLIRGSGAEVEYEKKWASGMRARASFARYFTRDANGDTPLNSPSWMAKANAILPAVLGWTPALEFNSISSLKTALGSIGSQTFANLNVTRRLSSKAEFSFLIYNLFNKNLRSPVGDDALGMGFVRDTFPAPGRGCVATLTLHI